MTSSDAIIVDRAHGTFIPELGPETLVKIGYDDASRKGYDADCATAGSPEQEPGRVNTLAQGRHQRLMGAGIAVPRAVHEGKRPTGRPKTEASRQETSHHQSRPWPASPPRPERQAGGAGRPRPAAGCC
jgi:hypothetical protein